MLSSTSISKKIIYKHVISGTVTYVCDDVKNTEQNKRFATNIFLVHCNW